MEKTELRDDRPDSSDPLGFETTILDSNLLRKVEHTDLPPPNKGAGESSKVSHRRRPISLKAELGIAKTDVSDSNKTKAKTPRQRKKTSKSAKSHHPIRLKRDTVVAKDDITGSKQGRRKAAPNKKKPSSVPRRVRPIRLKTDPEITRSNVSYSQEPPGKTTAQTKASVTANHRKATPVRADSPLSAEAPMEIPRLDFLQPWVSWVKSRRRLLLIVGMSFIAGILFHSWLEPDTSVTTRELKDSSQAAQRSTIENSSLGTQPVKSAADVSIKPPLPTPANNGYPQSNQGYREPVYGYGQQQQRPFSQAPSQEQSDFRYQTRPQTPLSSTWRPSAGQPTTDYRNRGRQRYNPWSPRDPQYPPYP